MKAHNGIVVDTHFLVEAAKTAGVEDPLQDLEDAGVLGIVDPARITPNYKLSSMMNKTKSKKGKEKDHYIRRMWNCTVPRPDFPRWKQVASPRIVHWTAQRQKENG